MQALAIKPEEYLIEDKNPVTGCRTATSEALTDAPNVLVAVIEPSASIL